MISGFKYIPIFLLISCNLTFAQTPNVQDCLGAVSVCDETYSESISYSGGGNIPNEVNPNLSCVDNENNSVWYVFTANTTGGLGFVLTPNDPNDDYDWALFDITNAACSEISTNANLLVSCNAAGGGNCDGATGATGASIYSIQGGGCGAFSPNQFSGGSPFNALVPMQVGNTYALMVSNWTGSTNGYSIDFSFSTGNGVHDEIKPEVANISTPSECNQDQITVLFSEFIQCSTIEAANFQLIGPGGPYAVELSSLSCGNNGHHDRLFNLTIDPPISSLGDFTLNLLTDQQDQVLDLCNNPADPFSWDFSVNTPIDLDVSIGGDTSLLCDGNTLVLSATHTGIDNLSYLWSDGSTDPILPVTTGGIYGVTVEDVCFFGQAETEVLIQYEVPIVELGNDQTLCPDETLNLDAGNDLSTYVWQDGTDQPTYFVDQSGNYTVAVTNACGTVSDEISIEYIEAIDLELGNDVVLCRGDSLVLNVSNPDATSYLWSDGFTGSKHTIRGSGKYKVTVETSCEIKSDSIEVTFIDDPVLSLRNDTLLCSGETIVYDFGIPGATYVWQDGSTDPIYTIAKTGDYAVTISTACNVLSDHITVVILDSIQTELGRDTFLCPGDRIILDASSETRSDYRWMDGDTRVTREISQPGTYSVRVWNECEEVTDEITVFECEFCSVFVPNAFSPNGDGINDKIHPFSDCELLDYDFKIFDRWGALIFQSTNATEGWDGTFNGQEVRPGIFIWQLDYGVLENKQKRREVLTGSVAVIR